MHDRLGYNVKVKFFGQWRRRGGAAGADEKVQQLARSRAATKPSPLTVDSQADERDWSKSERSEKSWWWPSDMWKEQQHELWYQIRCSS